MSTYLECYERVLRQNGKVTGKQGYFYCPFPGCAGYSKRKFNIDLESGAWYCFHCGQEAPERQYEKDSPAPGGGTALEFAAMMGDDPSLWPTGHVQHIAKSTITILSGKKRRELFTQLFELCTLSEEHRELIRARGIDPDRARLVSVGADLLERLEAASDRLTLIRGGLVYEDKSGQLSPRCCIQPGRLLIPSFDGEQVYFFVGYAGCPKRLPDQPLEQYQSLRESWVKISGPAGYTPAIYGDAPDGAEYLIITEGQLKAAAAIQRGFYCLGLQGMMSGHASVVKKCLAVKAKRVIILFDTQVEDQETVDWAAEKLARELLKASIPTYKAELPLDPEVDRGRKMDIDSFLLTQGVDAFIAILMQARPYLLQTGEDNETETDSTDTDSSDD